jgi:membrane protein required for colicin V production
MDQISVLDGVVIAILTMAIARGLFIGLIREGLSIAALGGSFIVVRYATSPAAVWLQETTHGEVGPTAAPLIMGTLIVIATIALVGFVGRGLKLGARAAGLGWADRLGGGVIGAIEGLLVTALLVALVTWALGHDDKLLRSSTSVEILDKLQSYVQKRAQDLPEVASPPKWLSE